MQEDVRRTKKPNPNYFGLGCNLANSLSRRERFAESLAVLRELQPQARRVLGPDHELCLGTTSLLALTLGQDPASSEQDLAQAQSLFQDTLARRRRIFGPAHPETRGLETRWSALLELQELQRG
mmetsp:Transcript_30602/g.94630  ORF Transcript_30602/g.94630 Transcript_30602/m.94630 type:complete len:124 (+) Transcript_30602:255-626(+)